MSGERQTGRERVPLLVVDAPGGPTPQFYSPRLTSAFEVHVVALAGQDDSSTQRRLEPLSGAGSVVVVDDPNEVRATVAAQAIAIGAHGVVAFSERVVQAAQFGALDAHLPSNAEPTLIALRDKVRQRRMFRAASIPTPRQVVIDADTDSDQIALAFPLPAVLKPVAGMGSIGTVRIAALDDLAAAVRSVRQIVECDPRTAHLTPQLVLEEELLGDPEATHGNTRGDYVSVEALTTAAGTRILAVQDKLPLAQPFRETGDLMPTVREGEELDAIIECAQGALSALGITFGVTHTEIKLTAEGPRIIEVNGRPGGGVCEMLALAADYDLVLHQARAAVDVDYCPPEVKFRSFAAYLSPQPPLGRWRLTAAASRQDLGRERAIAEIWEVQAVGAVVDAHDGTSSNLLRLLATADSQDELAALGSRLSSTDYFKLLPAADERTTR